MKKILSLLLFAIISQASIFAQAYIDNNLYYQLLDSNNDDFVSVNIYLTKQVNIDSLHQQFREQNTPLNKRAKIVLKQLQQMASQSQISLIDFIDEEKNKKAKNIQSFWIMNMISVEAKPDFIFEIAERNDVAIIELNTIKLKIEQPVKITTDIPKSLSEAEPGLIAINAHKLWAMGYTGKNRVGMNVDTGVNLKHPAISNNYLGKYFPTSQCWFPFNNPTPFDISAHSHGTHTIGTMMGLDPLTHDTIGVAFDSYWISSDPIVGDLYYLRTLPEVMSSFEWALNPDGDTSTVYDIPDVINNSWGWVDAPDTFQCNSPYTAVMDVCEAVGIAVVMSAGNDGDLGAGSVGEPAHKAKNLVNAFAVGSVNANNSSLQISSFSSLGPTLCADTGSLQIKPEVVAPGQDVRSAMGQDDYALLSGTSMAGPHAAGAILLLKEAFPFLSGEQLKLALYHSAFDLGVVGEDNTYGMGMIDVFAAYNYLAQTYIPISPVNNNWNITLDEIISPNINHSCNSTQNPQISFTNNGINTISEINIKLFADELLITDTIWNGTLLAGQSEIFSLISFELLAGYHIIKVELAIDGNPDEFKRFDNFGSHEIRIIEEFGLPFFENFDNFNRLFTNSPWFIENHDSLITWKLDTCSGMPNTGKSVYMDNFYYKPELGQVDDLISPLITMPDTGSVELSYDIAYLQRRSWTDDSLKIFVSTDCGVSFPYQIFANGGDSLETFAHNLGTRRFYPEREEHWRRDSIDISQFVGAGKIMLKFSGINDNGNSLWLDNIKVVGKPTIVAINEISELAFKIFPNPTSDILNIQFDNFQTTSNSFTIVDIHGKIIGQFNSSEKNIQLQISDYSNGIYFIHHSNSKASSVKRFSIIK